MNKSDVKDTAMADNQKMLIGGGVAAFLLVLLIMYMFSGGSSTTKGKPERSKYAPTTVQKAPSTVKEKALEGTSKSAAHKKGIVRADWGSYAAGTLGQAVVVYVLPVWICAVIYYAYQKEAYKWDKISGAGVQQSATNFFKGLGYGFILRDYQGTDANKWDGLRLLGCIGGVAAVIALVDVIAHYTDYNGYSVSAFYSFVLSYIGLGYYGGKMWYNMIYVEQAVSNKKKANSKK